MQFRKGSFEESLGTGFQGKVSAHYELLVERFGEPDFDVSDKTPAFWCIAFEDGTIATIYCWKTFTIPEGLWDWNVGGFEPQAVERVMEVIDANHAGSSGQLYYYIADKGNYRLLAREDNELVWFPFERLGEIESGIIRFSNRTEALAFVETNTSEPHLCHIVTVSDSGEFLHVLSD